MHIPQQTFIVTGAASGLGLATAARLVEQGARVVMADRSEQGRDQAARLGAMAVFVQADVTDEAQACAVVDAATQTFGALQGLINCAGIAPAEKLLGRDGLHSLATFQRVLAVNVVGTFNMIRFAAQAMRQAAPQAEGERGVVINTASVAAFDGQVGQAAYAASKAAVVGMTLPLARELARDGIRVVSLAPGVFETPMMAGMPQAVQDSLAHLVPFPKRLGRPAEFAALVQHVIENVMINGETIRLDGALRMPG